MSLLSRLIELCIVLFNRYSNRFTGGDLRPVFFDTRSFPAFKALEDNYSAIREELEGILRNRAEIPTYHQLDEMQASISGPLFPGQTSQWKVFMLYAMGRKPTENREACPKTCALLDQVPELYQAFFSILEPRKSVPAHEGPYRGYLRYHLGMIVPTDRPPRIRLKDQFYTWEERKGVLFDDSWEHQVYNTSDGIRVVLIVDILRPLPAVPRAINRFLANVVLRSTYAKYVTRNLR